MIAVYELKTRVGLGDTDDADSPLLEILEREAVADFERATNLYWGPIKQHVEVLPGGRSSVPYVRLRAPVVSVSKVEVLGGYNGIGISWTEPYSMTSLDFTPLDRRLYLISGFYFPAGRRNIRITYIGGYASPRDVPPDARGAIARWTAHKYAGGRQTVTDGNAPAPASTSVPSDVQDVINRWRRNPGL